MSETRSVAVKRIATTHPSAREPTNRQRTDTRSVPKQLQQPGKIRPNGVREAQPFSHEVGGLRQRGKLCQELVDREMTFENKIAAVFDLRDGVETRQVHLSPFPFGELRSQDQGPVIELFADDVWTQPVGSRLQFGRIVYR